jgi:hypothetical protein
MTFNEKQTANTGRCPAALTHPHYPNYAASNGKTAGLHQKGKANVLPELN